MSFVQFDLIRDWIFLMHFQLNNTSPILDLLSEYPDKKSILMYVMCLFQQLPASNIVIEDKEKNGATTMISTSSNNVTTTSSMKTKVWYRSERTIDWLGNFFFSLFLVSITF